MGEDESEGDLDVAPDDEGGQRLDELFDVLSDPLARYTLAYLSDHSTATLGSLADVVTGATSATTGTIATPDDRKRVRIRLYHVVLPKLDRAGYVDFDPDEKRATRANIPPRVLSLLEVDG